MTDTRSIARTKNGAEKILTLADLKIASADPVPAAAHFGELRPASATKSLLYVELWTYRGEELDPGPFSFAKYPVFLGKLDLATRRLSLVKEWACIAIDPESAVFYRAGSHSIEKIDFEGQVVRRWPVGSHASACYLAPEKKSLLISSFPDDRFRLLDLMTGEETPLPIRGCAPSFGPGGTIFFLHGTKRDGGIFETSLHRFRIGEKASTCLFLHSCKRIVLLDGFLGTEPKFSADGTWLAWKLPSESSEYKTVLLDRTNAQYRVLDSRKTFVPKAEEGFDGSPIVTPGDALGIGTPFPEPSDKPDLPPKGAVFPVEGVSTLVAAPFLKEVPRLRRKVVFFAKDADLPCLRVPTPGEFAQDPALDIGSSIKKIEWGHLSSGLMTKDGDLLLATEKSVFRVAKDGQAHKLFSISDLNVVGSELKPKELEIDCLLRISQDGRGLPQSIERCFPWKRPSTRR